MSSESYDVIIIGGGPAGLTAGIYTARHGLKTLILDNNDFGGKAIRAHMIENFPGFPEGLEGSELMDRFIKQAKKFGVIMKQETVIGLMDLGNSKMVSTRQGTHTGKAVIISTGIQRKKLQVPGEEEYKGLGVSYCAICDGPFFRNKKVVVIGAGEDAIEDALRLSEIVSRAYVIPGEDGFLVENEELRELKNIDNIEIIEGAEVEEIFGTDFVNHVKLDNGELLPTEGVFVILEQVPTSSIISDAGIVVDEGGCIIVDRRQHTNIEGIYAAGDCTCGGMQVVTAAGEGGLAALESLRYVKDLQRKQI
jgi:thioredoxin reductase (NADPH)